MPWLQSAHNPGKLKIFLFGQVGLENREISGWVLRPLTQTHPYSGLCVCKEHKMSCHSAFMMKGGNASLYGPGMQYWGGFSHCDRRGRKICSEHFRLFPFQNLPSPGFLRMHADCPWSPLVRGMLVLCFRRKQSFPLPHSHATLHVLAGLLLCWVQGSLNTLKWILETNCENFLWMTQHQSTP